MAAHATPSSAATAPLARADVVQQRGAGRHRGPGHRGLAGVDRDRAPCREGFDHRHDPAQLLGLVDGRPRAGGLAADVEPVGALGQQLEPWATAASASAKRPPSENESGVTLMTPSRAAVRARRHPRTPIPHLFGVVSPFRRLSLTVR